MKKNSAFQLSVVVFMLTGVALLFSACYKDYGLSTADYDVVITAYDEAADFEDPNYEYYYLDPEIIYLDDPDDSASNQPDNATTIMNTIIDQLENRYGYLPETIDNAGVEVIVAYSETNHFSYWYNYWYWWGWYYPPYWGGGGWTYDYTDGSLYIQMNDLNNPDPDDPEKFSALWFAGINGILNDSSIDLQQRIEDAIEQAYTQSPYLDRN